MKSTGFDKTINKTTNSWITHNVYSVHFMLPVDKKHKCKTMCLFCSIFNAHHQEFIHKSQQLMVDKTFLHTKKPFRFPLEIRNRCCLLNRVQSTLLNRFPFVKGRDLHSLGYSFTVVVELENDSEVT